MTEDDFTELDEFLLSNACGEESLSIDEAHGYLTALQLPPSQPDKTAWLKAIWGEPDFADERERQHLTELLEDLYDEIASTLAARSPFEPMVVETEEDGQVFESYEGWCYGFMLAVEQNPQQWELSKQGEALLAPIAQLVLQGAEDEEDMGEEEYAQWVELIPGAVLGLYDIWHVR